MLSGLTQYVPEATLTVYDNLEFLIRLLLSAALGALVGLVLGIIGATASVTAIALSAVGMAKVRRANKN